MEINATAIALHNSYVEFRNPTVPFPPESVATWCWLLAKQKQAGVRGDILELGVEHGGTAFLAAQAIGGDETLHLVDAKRSPQFTAMETRLPAELRRRIVFHECRTDSAQLAALTNKTYRFLHIDAGHLYPEVMNDLKRFAHLLSRSGILVLDDFFEIRWPEVTEAVLDYLVDSDVTPVALVNRKLYLSRRDDHPAILDALSSSVDALSAFGSLKHWTETLRGSRMIVGKLAVVPQVAREAMLRP